MESLHFQFPAWYLILCILAGIAYSMGMYWRDKSFTDQHAFIRAAMALLRAVTVTLLAALLLAPFLKLFSQTTLDPVIVVAQDNSRSVGQWLDQPDSTRYLNELALLKQKLGSRFNVVELAFGEEVRESGEFSFGDAQTDISEVLSYVGEQYGNENLGALILATDGLYNQGRQPSYVTAGIASPLHIIALGDTSISTDLRISKVLHNDIAFLGGKFPIQIDVAASNLDARSARLTVEARSGKMKGRILHSEDIQITDNEYFYTSDVLLDADEPGVARYRIQVSGIAGEESYVNNSRDIYIEVIDGRLQVLVLADIPHPDLAALKESITANENYSVDLFLVKDFEGRPEDYDLVIFHNLPSLRNDIRALHELVVQQEIPRIYFLGEQTVLPAFNGMQGLLSVEGSVQKPNEVTAIVDPDFELFSIPDDMQGQLRGFAPVYAPFGDYIVNPSAYVYMYQKIGSVDTQYPLILFGQQGDVKTAIFAAEGFWKWRLFDFLQNENQDLTNTLINKSVQYTTVKDDKRKFRVYPVKNLFTDIEPIEFTAELYNQSYELINTPDAFLQVVDSAGNTYDYTFSKTGNGYFIDIGRFPTGDYSYRGFADYAGQRNQVTGRFSVKEVQLELYNTRADHTILYQLADHYGGDVVYSGQLEDLADSILENDDLKPIIYSSALNTPVLNLRWIFAVFLVLLTAEWFMRRYFGGY